MQCGCTGCRNRITHRFADPPVELGRCDWPHSRGYSQPAFDQYVRLVGVLRRRRMALGLDQMDLGAAMGMADGYVNKLESFAKIASPSTLLVWLQAVGLEMVGQPVALPPATLEMISGRQLRAAMKARKE